MNQPTASTRSFGSDIALTTAAQIDAVILRVPHGLPEQPGFAASLQGVMPLGNFAVMPTGLYLAALAELEPEAWRFAGAHPRSCLALRVADMTFNSANDIDISDAYYIAGLFGGEKLPLLPSDLPPRPGEEFCLQPTFTLTNKNHHADSLTAVLTAYVIGVRDGHTLHLSANITALSNSSFVAGTALAYMAGEALGRWVNQHMAPSAARILAQGFEVGDVDWGRASTAFRQAYTQHTLDAAAQQLAKDRMAAWPGAATERDRQVAALELQWLAERAAPIHW